MAQLNSSMVIWFMGISQIPGKDLDGHCLLPENNYISTLFATKNILDFTPYILVYRSLSRFPRFEKGLFKMFHKFRFL
jgi:hypothetical protein